jgi:hypothetical protein
MALLSGFDTIAPARMLWEGEIDLALRATFGRPAECRPMQVFGFGIAHAMGMATDAAPDTTGLTPEQIFLAEWRILASLDGHERFVREEQERHDAELAFAKHQSSAAARLAAWQADAADKRQRFRVHAVSDFERQFFPAFLVAEIAADELGGLGGDGLEALIQRVPTIYTLTELRRVRFPDVAQGFKGTDLNDLRAISVAIPYCDIILVDKAWASAIRRTDLADRFGTLIATSVPEVAELLGL